MHLPAVKRLIWKPIGGDRLLIKNHWAQVVGNMVLSAAERVERDRQKLSPVALAQWLLARVAEKDKQPDVAEREYRAEIAASHSGARAWLDLAGFLRHEKRYEEMKQALHTLSSSLLDRPEALMHAAQQLFRSELDLPFAVGLLERYLKAPVEDGPAFKAHDLLGQIYEKQGDKRAAADEFRAALALAHSYTRAQENLKRVER